MKEKLLLSLKHCIFELAKEVCLMGLLRTILIIILVYYVLKLLGRALSPVATRYASKKAYSSPRKDHSHAKEGETVIDSYPPQKRGSTKKAGEYIDFEEID